MQDTSSSARLKLLLQTRGMESASTLMRELKVSRATFSRLIQALSQEIIRIGKTNQSHYAILKQASHLESELPTFRINGSGALLPESRLFICNQQTYIFMPEEKVFRGYPPEIADLIPQGFMGRAFAKKYAQELEISDRPQDWSEDSIWKVLSKRGEDLPGNLIVGEESATRFQRLQYKETKLSAYSSLAHTSLLGQTAGSSAGGEQPKFTAFRKGAHRLVKFGGVDKTPAQTRVRDLLICESHALSILSKHGIETAKTELIEDGHFVFLDSIRFDRVGMKGRKAVLTLAALDDFYFGKRDHWSASAERLFKEKLISASDVRKIKLLDAYGMWIGNTDRHFHNLSFLIESSQSANPKYLLAPAFDQLPMFYMPVAGQVLDKDFEPPVPYSSLIEVWIAAKKLGRLFWETVKQDSRISSSFRKIAASNLKKIDKA
jgi:biotin operon repressor